jgi:hypothetical protein
MNASRARHIIGTETLASIGVNRKMPVNRATTSASGSTWGRMGSRLGMG